MKKLFVWGFAPVLLVASLFSSALYAAAPQGVLLDRALAGVVSDVGWCCHQPAEAEMPAQAAAADRELPGGGGEAAILSRTEAGRSMQSSGSVPIAHNANTAARLLPGGAAASTGFS